MRKQSWFEVDKEGLAKLLRRRGMAFVLFELLQNCYDTSATNVRVMLRSTDQRGICELSVIDDDPNGFQHLDHAYTLFAESIRKNDPDKRGRFNLGEKLILAVCNRAEIRSTKGTIIFSENGRKRSKKYRESGTEFYGLIRMTKPEMADVLEACLTIIAPIPTIINDRPIPERTPIHEFTATLPTEIADEEGILRRTSRRTRVRIYDRIDPVSRLYEMGIPVVETSDPWDVEVMQKIPMNTDRDNVTPAYLRTLRTFVINEMHRSLPDREASLPAVLETLPTASADAVNSILTKQYGEKRAIYDPSDPEANRTLQAQGYQLIAGRSFSQDAWRNIRSAGAAKPSGQIAPSYKPYSTDGKPAVYLSEDKWTPGMKDIAEFVRSMGARVLGWPVKVRFEKGRMTSPFAANYGSRTLTFNLDRLGKKWFDQGRTNPTVLELIIHELAHEYGGHLTKEFDDGLARVGARMIQIAATEPNLFL